ncbi:hypothetical protein ACT8ZS_18010 [Paenibacillus sp. M.A.Huq-84]
MSLLFGSSIFPKLQCRSDHPAPIALVHIRVSDNGVGMDEEQLQRLKDRLA